MVELRVIDLPSEPLKEGSNVRSRWGEVGLSKVNPLTLSRIPGKTVVGK